MENKDNQPIEGLNEENNDKKSSDSVLVKNTYEQYYFGYGTDSFNSGDSEKVDVVVEHTDGEKVVKADGEKEKKDGFVADEKPLTDTGKIKESVDSLDESVNPHYFTSGTDKSDTPTSGFLSGEEFDKRMFTSGSGKDFSYLGDNKVNEQSKNKGLGIASMVLGILSVVCCCMDGIAIILAILAIVFAAIRIKTKADGFAIAGLVTGIVGALFNLIMFILLVSGIANEIYYESFYTIIRFLLK